VPVKPSTFWPRLSNRCRRCCVPPSMRGPPTARFEGRTRNAENLADHGYAALVEHRVRPSRPADADRAYAGTGAPQRRRRGARHGPSLRFHVVSVARDPNTTTARRVNPTTAGDRAAATATTRKADAPPTAIEMARPRCGGLAGRCWRHARAKTPQKKHGWTHGPQRRFCEEPAYQDFNASVRHRYDKRGAVHIDRLHVSGL